MWVVTDPVKRKHVLTVANLAFGVQHPTPHVPVDNPVSLDRDGIRRLQDDNYIVAYKADGTRYLLVLTLYQGRPLAALVDRAGKMFALHVQAQWSHFQRNSVFDGELCAVDDGHTQHYLVFNALIDQGVALMELPYPQRLQYVQNNFPAHPLSTDERRAVTSFVVPLAPLLHFVCKEWDFARNMRALLRNVIPRYATDGFVLTPADQPVVSGRNPTMFKWKHDHPIDVRVRSERQLVLEVDDHGTPVALAQVLPFITFVADAEWDALFSGWRLYDQLMTNGTGQFNHVVEMKCVPSPRGFSLQYLRLRPDKEGPNNVQTVQRTLQSIRDAITQEELFTAIGKV